MTDGAGRFDDGQLEDDGVLEPADTLDGAVGDDPLDDGYDAPDRWSAGERFGTTLSEERAGESLDQLLAEEEPDTAVAADDASDADVGADGDGPEPGTGRLVADDEGAHPDTESELVARDVGDDGGGVSAEEGAVHMVGDGEPPAR